MNPRIDPDLKRAEAAVAAIGVVLSIGAWSFFGARVGGSVLAGAIVASLNLAVLARSVARLLAGASAKWGFLAFLKFIALLALTFVLVDRNWVDALGLAVGFGALPLGVVVGSLFGSTVTEPLPGEEVAPGKELDHA